LCSRQKLDRGNGNCPCRNTDEDIVAALPKYLGNCSLSLSHNPRASPVDPNAPKSIPSGASQEDPNAVSSGASQEDPNAISSEASQVDTNATKCNSIWSIPRRLKCNSLLEHPKKTQLIPSGASQEDPNANPSGASQMQTPPLLFGFALPAASVLLKNKVLQFFQTDTQFHEMVSI
jgi:hypothetical protein